MLSEGTASFPNLFDLPESSYFSSLYRTRAIQLLGLTASEYIVSRCPLNLGKIQGLGGSVVPIGGAGTFDGILLTGIMAVLPA